VRLFLVRKAEAKLATAILLYLVYNVVYSLVPYPADQLWDRVGPVAAFSAAARASSPPWA